MLMCLWYQLYRGYAHQASIYGAGQEVLLHQRGSVPLRSGQCLHRSKHKLKERYGEDERWERRKKKNTDERRG